MKALLIICILAALIITGCTTVQKGAATGAVLGGGLGAVIGHQSGHGREGAGIGAAAGAISGAIIGDQMDKMFCPQCGRKFVSSLKYCPYDQTELKLIQK
ncbi:MAG: YMGG-like glycine zipper-containing protein [Candidatus Omnitrophota bacterium]